MKIYCTPPSRYTKVYVATLNESTLNDECLFDLSQLIVEYLENVNKDCGWAAKTEEDES
jgi:hypothetical protein